MLTGGFSRCGYDWWWHSFTGYNEKTGEEKAFFIEFFLCNPAGGKDEPVFGQLPENKKNGIAPSYLMVKAGSWGTDGCQLHRFWGWNKISVRRDTPFSITADDCCLDETQTAGAVSLSPETVQLHPEYMCQAGEMSWNLKISKKIAFNVGYGAGKLFRKLQLFEMFWHVEGMKTLYDGEVFWNGEKYRVSGPTCNGYADKNWGRDFTSPWVWISSNNLYSCTTGTKLENSAFDIGGGCPKIGPIALKRKLLSAVWHEGKCYEFNFSKFWTFTRTKFECSEDENRIHWHICQKNLLYSMEVTLSCDKSRMILVNYEAPNGTKRHNKLWNGGSGEGIMELRRGKRLIDKIKIRNAGCEYGEYHQ